MNFFERKRLLKNTNALDLTPVRVLGHSIREDGNVTLLMPRFRNKYWSRMFQPRTKRLHIHINLDKFGSHTWLLIDGVRQVSGICERLKEQFPGQFQPVEETEERVSKFIFLLYQQRYITFREFD